MAVVTATPNPVYMGEQFKIEATGFNLGSDVTVSVDGDEVGTAHTRPSPEGGVADFYTAVETPGTFQVEVNQPKGEGTAAVDASVEVEVLSQWAAAETVAVSPEPVAEPEGTRKQGR